MLKDFRGPTQLAKSGRRSGLESKRLRPAVHLHVEKHVDVRVPILNFGDDALDGHLFIFEHRLRMMRRDNMAGEGANGRGDEEQHSRSQ